jgi:RNA polymerase sigma-70 factor (ECF subfamily)
MKTKPQSRRRALVRSRPPPKRLRIKIKTDFSDDLLVAAAQRGSKKAFTILYERHHLKMRNTAYGLCRDDIDADDICQIAWARAWKRIRKFRNDSSFSTWMTVIIRNVFFDERRKKNRNRTDSLEQFQSDDGRPDQTQRVVDPGVLPDRAIQDEDTARFVRRMVAKMPEPHRTVMRLHFFDGFKHEEIAKRMRTPVGTSLSRLAYGKVMLRKIVEKNLNGERHDALS